MKKDKWRHFWRELIKMPDAVVLIFVAGFVIAGVLEWGEDKGHYIVAASLAVGMIYAGLTWFDLGD